MSNARKTTDYMKLFSLLSKTAIIMGGTGLIGREISIAMAQAGARVIILDINEEKGIMISNELSNEGYLCEYIKCDLTQTELVKKHLNNIMDEKQSIDILVNAFYPRTDDWGNSIEDMKRDSWSKNVEMHMNSYCIITAYVAEIMKENSISGCIINLGSIYGIIAPDFSIYEGTNMTNPPAYSAIKAGIIHFTKYVASYYGKYGIRANIVCPGGIYDNQKKVFVENYNKKTPLGRMGKAEETASVCIFLASEASSYITGSTIMVDGGWTCI